MPALLFFVPAIGRVNDVNEGEKEREREKKKQKGNAPSVQIAPRLRGTAYAAQETQEEAVAVSRVRGAGLCAVRACEEDIGDQMPPPHGVLT